PLKESAAAAYAGSILPTILVFKKKVKTILAAEFSTEKLLVSNRVRLIFVKSHGREVIDASHLAGLCRGCVRPNMLRSRAGQRIHCYQLIFQPRPGILFARRTC